MIGRSLAQDIAGLSSPIELSFIGVSDKPFPISESSAGFDSVELDSCSGRLLTTTRLEDWATAVGLACHAVRIVSSGKKVTMLMCWWLS